MDEEIRRAGLSAASAWATSPTVGGLSWLAHGTLLSGLWIDRPGTLRPPRPKHPAEPQPPVCRSWLAERSHHAGHHARLARVRLFRLSPGAGREGSRLSRQTVQLGDHARSIYAVGLRASLARFGPCGGPPCDGRAGADLQPCTLDARSKALSTWARIGDGTIFDNQAVQGPAPAVLWADPERVRAQYIATIDYSLETLGSYLARFGKDAVFVILGDHQPASIITGPAPPAPCPSISSPKTQPSSPASKRKALLPVCSRPPPMGGSGAWMCCASC